MPGVPSGRGCESCRKQKKKCDQATPSCSRCARLGLLCVGAGQQRYKFMGQYGSQVTFQHSTKQVKLEDDKQTITITTSNVPKSPTNGLTSLLGAYVNAIQPATDLRYNLAWTYGGYLTEVPIRLGTNEALDAAASALLDAHSNYCAGRKVGFNGLAKYSRALKTLRYCLDNPVKAKAAETLCAVNLLLVCQALLGLSDGAWSGHVEGMVQMIIARGNAQPKNGFEISILRSMRGSIIFEGLANSRIKLPVHEWKRLADNPLDGDSYEGKLMRSMCMVPYFIESRASKKIPPEEDAKHLAEIIAGYHMLKPVLVELRKLYTDIVAKLGLDTTDKTSAYIIRTYGLSLAIAIIINCVLSAVYTDDEQYPIEADEFSKDILTISDLAKQHRPLGSSYIPLCLSTAWIGSRDPLTRYVLEDALNDYQNHPTWGQMVKITVPDLVWTEKRLKLQNPKTPFADDANVAYAA